MINRRNWKLVKKYLRYRIEVDQLAVTSVQLEERWLRHLLEWADEIPFINASKIRPTFPRYIQVARIDGSKSPFSPEYTRKIVRTANRFFSWLSTHQYDHRSIEKDWIDSLKPQRGIDKSQYAKAITFDEVLAISKASASSTWERRIRASAVFWYLSGIRIGAFVSLPIKAVDIENRTIRQWPQLGVQTKLRKHATTYLLDVPDLITVVQNWDEEVRFVLSEDDYWFAPISADTRSIDPNIKTIGNHRTTRARKDLRRWMGKVGLPYRSPHQFRHGHAVYAIKQAQDVADLKAVSQNLMHTNLSITDGVYGILSETDVRERIGTLGSSKLEFGSLSRAELKALLSKAAAEL